MPESSWNRPEITAFPLDRLNPARRLTISRVCRNGPSMTHTNRRRGTFMSRRWLACGLGLALGFAASAAQAVEPPNVQAQHVYIVDYNTGSVLYDKQGTEKLHPASMSKLMTLYMLFDAVKRGDVKLTDKFHVSKKAWSTQGSKMFVPIDGDIMVEDLIRGIIVQSGNDACVVVAEGLAGSEEAFADRMNKKAKELGLTDSNFTN